MVYCAVCMQLRMLFLRFMYILLKYILLLNVIDKYGVLVA